MNYEYKYYNFVGSAIIIIVYYTLFNDNRGARSMAMKGLRTQSKLKRSDFDILNALIPTNY